VDVRRLQVIPSPARLLCELPQGDNWSRQTRGSLARLQALFLVCEDPQRRLDSRPVNTLAHQVSLVRHVLDNPHLGRVLIGDEVGLGKTVEAGLIIQELMTQNPGLRVLYLAPARLAQNVRAEMDRLGLGARLWTSVDADARLDDQRIIASIHRAVHRSHFDRVVNTQPWDVLVVDECHHLTDWAEGGGDAGLKYRLVEQLIARLRPDGRVIFLSGTPHQGHAARFENLLTLLRRPGESDEDIRGRVIYRTKEDVSDWDGRPLFPGRQVNLPILVDLGGDHRAWLELIREYYAPTATQTGSEARQRAAGWRCAQALQWAASSPQAGLGYLVRQAIRAGWSLEESTLREALAALRPYRNGAVDEPIAQLYGRLQQEVQRQLRDADVEDLEDVTDFETGALDDPDLAELLRCGLTVLGCAADAKWDMLREQVLEPAGREKVVLFAQPVETVLALAGYLRREMKEEPALILGGQTDAQRERQVRTFRDPAGPRFLVSSRAGGEGINLQVSRRLVHLDVPWNPMEMEQRVGRVHRFGSRQTILVDTLVVRDSREVDAYRIAREKLRLVASTVVEPERFEALFSRVMCLIPPEDLIDVLGERPCGPLNHPEQERLGQLVHAGYRRWSEFHDRYAQEQQRIRQQDPGQATWDDLACFLGEQANAKEEQGYSAERFVWVEGQAEPVAEAAKVLRLGERMYACGDYAGTRVTGANQSTIEQIGLNSPQVSELLRRCAFPDVATGAAHLGWPRDKELPGGLRTPVGLLVFLRQTVKALMGGGYGEHAAQLVWDLVAPDGGVIPVERDDRGKLLRDLLRCTVRLHPHASGGELDQILLEQERNLIPELTRPTNEDREHGRRHAATPVFAAILTSG
jgi:superfamily II DNA or RNA helicase